MVGVTVASVLPRPHAHATSGSVHPLWPLPRHRKGILETNQLPQPEHRIESGQIFGVGIRVSNPVPNFATASRIPQIFGFEPSSDAGRRDKGFGGPLFTLQGSLSGVAHVITGKQKSLLRQRYTPIAESQGGAFSLPKPICYTQYLAHRDKTRLCKAAFRCINRSNWPPHAG